MIIELQVISEGKDTEESMEKCQQRLETGGREMDYQRYLARDRKKKNVTSKYQLVFLSCAMFVNSGLRVNNESTSLVPSSPLYRPLVRGRLWQSISLRVTEMEEVLMKLLVPFPACTLSWWTHLRSKTWHQNVCVGKRRTICSVL